MGTAGRWGRPSLNAIVLVVAFGAILIATGSAWFVVEGTNATAVGERIASDTAETGALFARLSSGLRTAPVSTAGLMATVGDVVSKDTFNSYAAPLLEEDLLVAIRWVPYVPGDQRPTFEATIRQSGLLEFAITDRAADGTYSAAGTRDAYYPVMYQEPFAEAGDVIGYDMGTNAERFAAIEDARDTGALVVTPPVMVTVGLPDGGAPFAGQLLMQPAYIGGVRPETLEERRSQFLGVAVAVFKPQSLLTRAAGGQRFDDLAIFLYDLGPLDQDQLPYDQAILVASKPSTVTPTIAVPPAEVIDAGYKAPPGSVYGVYEVSWGNRREWLVAAAGSRYAANLATSTLPIVLTALASLAAVALYAVQRRRFEGALAGAAARLRSVLSASPDAFVGLDEQGRVVDWSEQATRLFEIPRAAALGRRVSSLLEVQPGRQPAGGAPDAPVEAALATLPTSGSTIAMELTALRANGVPVPVDVTMAISPTATRWTVACFIRDATERYRSRDELLRARATEAIGELTGRLAHDFNNLLGIIVGTLDLARDDLEDRPETQRLLDMAMAAGVRGADVTKALLAVARRQALAPADLDLNDTVREVFPLLRQAVGAEITVELDLADEPVMSHLDPGGLTNAVLNLVINAAHAMPEGGIIRVRTRCNDDGCTIAVADTGVGIPPEALARVFEPFYTTKKGGTGLGLAIVLGFANQSKGTASIDSKVGVGTTVTLHLPSARGEVQATTAVVPEVTTGTERVLVVDDESGLREIAARWLLDAGYQVWQAPSGPAAFAMLDSVQPQLLVTDVVMPGEYGGLELARRARAAMPDLRIVLASGYAGVDLEGVIESGLPLLEKPYRRASLLTASRQALDASVPLGLTTTLA